MPNKNLFKLKPKKLGEFKCGCHAGQHYEAKSFYIAPCPLHSAAPDLLAACKAVLSQTNVYQTPMLKNIREKLEVAIRLAESKPQ